MSSIKRNIIEILNHRENKKKILCLITDIINIYAFLGSRELYDRRTSMSVDGKYTLICYII